MQASASPKKRETLVYLALLGIIALGAGLRMYQIGAKTVWLDEAFSIWMARNSAADLLRWIIDIDQHPPLYYLLLHFWVQLGGWGAAWVRGFSALASILTIPAIFLLGRRLAGSWAGVLAALVLALNPYQASYGQEARTYAFLTLTVTLALWAAAVLLTDPRARSMPIGQQFVEFFRAWRQARRAEKQQQAQSGVGYSRDFREDLDWVRAPTRRRAPPLSSIQTDLAWLVSIISTAATVYCHNTAFFFPIGVNLFVFGLMLYRRLRPGDENQLQPPSFWNWFTAQVGVFLLWSPWLLAFYYQFRGVEAEFWIPRPTARIVLETLQMFLNAYLPGNISWSAVIWLLFVAVILLGAISFYKKPAHALFLLLIFAAPIAGELLASLQRPIFYHRTLIWAPIPIYVLIGAGLRALRFKPYILAAVAMLAVVNLLSLRDYYRYYEKERWDQAAAYVGERVQDGDMILFNAGWTQLPFDVYFAGYHRQVDELGAPATLFERGVLEPIMRESDVPRLRSLIRGRERIWLVYSHNWYTDPGSLIPRTLGDELSLLGSREFNGMQIFLYGIR